MSFLTRVQLSLRHSLIAHLPIVEDDMRKREPKQTMSVYQKELSILANGRPEELLTISRCANDLKDVVVRQIREFTAQYPRWRSLDVSHGLELAIDNYGCVPCALWTWQEIIDHVHDDAILATVVINKLCWWLLCEQEDDAGSSLQHVTMLEFNTHRATVDILQRRRLLLDDVDAALLCAIPSARRELLTQAQRLYKDIIECQ